MIPGLKETRNLYFIGPARRSLATMITLFLVLAAGRVLAPPRCEAQEVALASDPDSSSAETGPRFTRTDWFILGGGAGLALFSHFALDARIQEVPPTGLDPDDIVFELDRNSIHDPHSSALAASDMFLLASLAYPTAISLVTADSGWDSHLEMWRIQGEALALGVGATTFLKVVFSRPRPYTYLPEDERPDLSDYSVDEEDAFRSFPSGHATAAWASSMSAVSYLAVHRPELPPLVHFFGGVVGGGLATSTSLLRVDAGRHFPTDVMGGALIGSGAGVGMSLFHRPESPQGPNWVPGLLGVAAGTLLAFLLTPPTSPWVN